MKKITQYTSFLTFIVLMLTFVFLFFIRNSTFKQYNLVQMDIYDGQYKELYGCTLNDFLETKKFSFYEFTGKEEKDEKLLKQYQQEVANLVASKDSVKGIHVKFNKNTTYQNFINAFDVCFIEDAQVYIYDKDDLWITNEATKEFQKKYPFVLKPIK